MNSQEGTSKLLGDGRRAAGFEGECTFTRDVLNLVGDKWSVLVVVVLGERQRRFNELKRAIGGISQRMLTFTLRSLEREGLVERHVHPTVRLRVDYALTNLGSELLEPVRTLARFAQGNRGRIQEARERFDRQTVGRVDLAVTKKPE